ncbi:MAG: AAA family ATPase, partial [Burkholderiales bacterium]|nr:AAA family ATPase [Burkholderiales bacterium]
MAFVAARPLNLLLSWGADRLNACLSDGHTLGRMGQLTVAPQLLSAASTEGWAALQGEPAERERWGRVIFQQLFPPAIGQALSGSPGGLLQLQLSDALLEIPWELAFDGNSYLGQKYAVNRQLTRDKLPNPGLLRQARQRPGLKVLLLYEQTDSGRQQAYARALGSRLAKLTGVSPLAMALPTHGFAALLRQTAGSDIVHCVASPGGLAHLPLPDMAALACPPQHLIVEDTAETALAGQGLQALHKLSRVASAAALDLLVHLPNAWAQNRIERMVDFYTAYAAGQALDLALRCWRQAPQARLLCYAAGSSGSALASASQSPGDHLRQITVLSYDLVESTKLLRRLGAERYSETLGRFHGECAEAVSRWGGQANAAQGNDGVMCFFGMPVAHEDATAMALKAALAMVDAVSQLGLAVRIGVVTGPVVVSAGLPLGEPIHLAARLQALAKPGTIVVAESSRSMVQERFTFVPMGSMPALKGFGQTDAAYVLVSEQRQVDTLSDHLYGGACVGRQRELAQLDGAWARACGGTLAAVDISGEAGIGKTRLVHEFMRRLQDTGAQVLELRCDPECTDSAFQPVLELLARRFG